MSHVQLSGGLERLAARRTFPLQKRTSVCRSLFGPVDHDELQREMKTRLREISERDQERWNFNFEANSPMDGLYEWEEVSADQAPTFYREKSDRVPATPVKRRPEEPDTPLRDVMERLSAPEAASSHCPAELNQENRKDKMNSGRTPRSAPGAKRRRPEPQSAQITDFFVKRKKVVSSCLLSAKSPVPVEQTPRKRIR